MNKKRKINPRAKTTEKFKQEVFELYGDEYTVLGEYKDCHTHILIRHNICGHEWNIVPTNFTRGKKCPKCSTINTIKKLTKTTEKFKQEVFELYGDEYTVLGEYKTTNTKILMRHNICNTEYYVSPNNFLHGTRCANCFKSIKRTIEDFKQEVFELYGDEYTVLDNIYYNTNYRMRFRHNVCGNIFKSSAYNFLNKNIFCHSCTPNPKAFNNEIYEEIVYNLVKDEYSVLGEYINSQTLILMKHNICKHEYSVRPNDFQQGCRCPKCSNAGTSKPEIEISEFIESITSLVVIRNSKNIIKPLELDIYLPELKLAIEFDGLYWHSELHKDSNYHLNKTLECNKLGIRLIHIFEDEWRYKRDIVKSKLRNLICKDSIKIYARKCWIEEISPKDKNIFLNENHIQGSDKSNIKLSLWTNMDNEEICVAVMTFCKPRRSLGQTKNSGYDYELSRYATQSGYSVIGGFSKLLSYFKKNYEWKKIITYADIRWSDLDNNVYLTNGFTYLHSSKPNYWYNPKSNKPANRYHRYSFRKQVLKEKFPKIYSDNKTEKQIMTEAGFIRIYDCGNMVYEYIKE